MLNNSEYYQLSSKVPKSKKSIKKYKRNYHQSFLRQLKSQQIAIAPQKFLQPVLYYRFFNDIIVLDNLNSFGDKQDIYQLDLQLADKSISCINS